MSLTPSAIREIFQLQQEADALLQTTNLSRAEQKRADLLIAKISSIRQAGISSTEIRQQLANAFGREIGAAHVDFDDATPEQRAHEKLFRDFLSGAPDGQLERESRAVSFKAGEQTPIFSSGPEGGVLVPISFAQKVAEGRAATDPLFNPDLVTLIQEDTFRLPPLSIPGWDLSEITATKVDEAAQKNPDVVPEINSKLTNRWTYRVTLAGSMEFEQDSAAYGSAQNAMGRAFGVAFGRGVSADLITGDGTTGPQGALTGAVDSGVTTANAGKIVLADINDIFFSLNAAYRNAPKCAWVMNDATWKLVNNAVDDQHRPLISVENGQQMLKGKPVHISPSMPAGAGSTGILFGDFSSYYVHSSSLFIRRRMQYPGLVEYGKVAWTGLQMVDAVVDDPTDGANSGAFSPIKFATLHA